MNNNLKNTVVLKNLPSNIVEEAVIVFKPNIKLKEEQELDNNNKEDKNKERNKEKDYILKEAEMLVNNYIRRVEEKKKIKNEIQKKVDKKCKNLKKYVFIMGIILLLETIFIIINQTYSLQRN